MSKPQKLESLFDVYIDAPEGCVPEKLHILLNSKFKSIADQYKNALFMARGIPFSQSLITLADPVALTYSKLLVDEIPDDKERAARAITMAMSTYERWADEAEKESWSLAMLTDNVFSNAPLPYPPQEEGLPGLLPELNPVRNLQNRTERRLKQILDYLDTDITFRMEVEAAINGQIAGAIRLAETDDAGFRS